MHGVCGLHVDTVDDIVGVVASLFLADDVESCWSGGNVAHPCVKDASKLRCTYDTVALPNALDLLCILGITSMGVRVNACSIVSAKGVDWHVDDHCALVVTDIDVGKAG